MKEWRFKTNLPSRRVAHQGHHPEPGDRQQRDLTQGVERAEIDEDHFDDIAAVGLRVAPRREGGGNGRGDLELGRVQGNQPDQAPES
jgi:hypothetical protein